MVITEAGRGAPAVGKASEILDVGFVTRFLDVVIETQDDAGEQAVVGKALIAVVKGVVRQRDDPLVIRRARSPPAQALKMIGDWKVARIRWQGGVRVLNLVIAPRESGLQL